MQSLWCGFRTSLQKCSKYSAFGMKCLSTSMQNVADVVGSMCQVLCWLCYSCIETHFSVWIMGACFWQHFSSGCCLKNSLQVRHYLFALGAWILEFLAAFFWEWDAVEATFFYIFFWGVILICISNVSYTII